MQTWLNWTDPSKSISEKGVICEEAVERRMEAWMRAYEVACFRYLDGGLEKGQFREEYEAEITSLVESDEYYNFYHLEEP